jgi:hypothetical protein
VSIINLLQRKARCAYPCLPCRRESVDVEDLVYAHVLGMDALARGLRNAAALKESGLLESLVADRYASWHQKGGVGEKIAKGKVSWYEAGRREWNSCMVLVSAGSALCCRTCPVAVLPPVHTQNWWPCINVCMWLFATC